MKKLNIDQEGEDQARRMVTVWVLTLLVSCAVGITFAIIAGGS
jgi:hypothetical protein